jgi:uncharacterized lipoprotein YddW (UPF0748 family)
MGEIRGVWLTTNDTETLIDGPKMQQAVRQMAEVNLNTIYPVVWNSGYAIYASDVVKQAGIETFLHKGLQGQDILEELIIQAHRERLLVIPWFEFGFMAPPTSELALNRPHWLTQQQNGTQEWVGAAGKVVWLNPFHPQVQAFIQSLVLELVTRYDIDGIQFDDHLSLPREFGYDDYTTDLYFQETKKKPPTNFKDEEWVRWRADKITAFVTQLNQAVKAIKPKAIFSVAPNPYYTAYNAHLQDWLSWVRKGLVDELVVQIYRLDLKSFQQEITTPEIQEAKQKIPTAVGVLTGLRNRKIAMQFVEAKVMVARNYGMGVSFFFYDTLWNYAPEPSQERILTLRRLFSYPLNRLL